MSGLAACYDGEIPTCTIVCTTDSECPGDLTCSPQGRCSEGGASCTVFSQPLTVSMTGTGTITSDPAGINCGTTCTADFDPDSTVTLTATPGSTSVFEGWSGDCVPSPTGDSCTVTMDSPKTAAADFKLHGANRWLKQISFPGQDFLDGELEVDATGNVLVAGRYNDTDTSGTYVAKYEEGTGALLWEQKITKPMFSFTVGGMDTDSAGNVYLCMRTTAFPTMSASLGNGTISGDLYGNITVVRLAAATGAYQWVKSWGGDGQDECGGVAVSGNDLFVTGGTSSTNAMFDSVSMSSSVNQGYIVRANISNGIATVGKHLPANFQDIYDIAAANGEVAIVGSFTGSLANNPGCNMSASGTGYDGMIMNFSSSLACVWTRSFGSNTANENTSAYGIAAYPGGGYVITGSYAGAVLFAAQGSSLVNRGGSDAFVARYDASGTHVWSFGYGSTGTDIGRGVDVMSTGEVVFGGTFTTTIQFGSTVLTGNAGNNDVFVTRMSSGVAPVHQWATSVGGMTSEQVSGVHIDSRGTVSVLTYFNGMSDVGGMPLTAVDYDAWVASFVR